MRFVEPLRSLPEPIKKILRFISPFFISKYSAELSYWRNRHRKNGGKFHNAHYRQMMLAMAQESDDRFLQGKVVADFGCGPRGSLVWATAASLRIGIDVLVERYATEFKDDIMSHGMVYLKSTEEVIPLPSDFIDILFTLNALDHVDFFPKMCIEILRIIKTGGLFIGSFNLEGSITATEPQKLTEAKIHNNLLSHLEVHSYQLTKPGPHGNVCKPFLDGNLHYEEGEEGILWVKGVKKSRK